MVLSFNLMHEKTVLLFLDFTLKYNKQKESEYKQD